MNQSQSSLKTVVCSFQLEQNKTPPNQHSYFKISIVTAYCKRIDWFIFQLKVNHLHSSKTVIQNWNIK